MVAQLVRVFALQPDGWVFESQPRQNLVVKTGSDSSTAKRSATGVSVEGPRRWLLLTNDPCHSRCGMLKNPYCSMAVRTEHRSKFAALSWKWWHIHMFTKFSSGTKNSKHNYPIIANHVQNVLSSPSFGGSYAESVIVRVAWDDEIHKPD